MTFQSIEKTQDRIHWEDGTFSDFVTLKFPAGGFHFLDIDQRDPLVKLKDAACLRWVKAIARGETRPRIVAFLRLERDRPVSALLPELPGNLTRTGEELFSANSLITYTLRTLLAHGWLRYAGGHWQVTAPETEAGWQQQGEAVLALLEGQNHLYLELGPAARSPDALAFEGFDAMRNLIPIGRLGFPRNLVWRERPRIVFNTAFFLLEHHDFFSFHSALGEPYGLFVQDGIIHRPPLYRRAALFQRTDGSWRTDHFSLEDVSLTLPDGRRLAPTSHAASAGESLDRTLLFALNVAADVTIYTRVYGIATHRRVLGRTPHEPGRIELTVIDRRVAGWKVGGGLEIPQNGFVLSFAASTLTSAEQAALRMSLRVRPVVRYRFVWEEHQNITQALQVGPLLVQGGRSVLTPASLHEEEFWIDRHRDDGSVEIGVVPTEFPDDVDRTRAGRIGLGVDREGQLVVVGVAGAEKGANVPGVDSHGATLADLADLLADAGAVEAINLDGGGSTQVFYLGGLTTVAGSRLGLPGVHYERMVPSAGVLR